MLKIKYLRNKKKESQTYLANLIGVSLRTIQNYESGKVDVPRKKLDMIAQHYDVSISYLFSEEKEHKNEEKTPKFHEITESSSIPVGKTSIEQIISEQIKKTIAPLIEQKDKEILALKEKFYEDYSKMHLLIKELKKAQKQELEELKRKNKLVG